MSRPPRFAERLLGWLLPRASRDEVLGDLAEAHAARREGSPLGATLWYLLQVVSVPIWLVAHAARSVRLDGGEVVRTLRNLRRSPGFAAMAVLSLSVGIGATTAVVGTMRALLFVPLPVDEPGELALLYARWPEEWEGSQIQSSSAADPEDGVQLLSNVSYPSYRLLDELAGDRIGVAGYAGVRQVSVEVGDRPATAASGMAVSGDFFRTLRLETALGRGITPLDDLPNAPRVAVLSHGFWRRATGGDSAVVGRTIRLNGASVRVVGVAQEGYEGLSPAGLTAPSEVIVPLSSAPPLLTVPAEMRATLTSSVDLYWVRLLARIPGSTVPDGLEAELSTALGQTLVADGVIDADAAEGVELRFLEGRRGVDSLRREAHGPLNILSVVVVVVLLIACGNLASLLLARGADRREELAVRRAIGAGRWEIARPLLTESLTLAAAGAAGGVLIALWGGPMIASVLAGAASDVRFEPDGALLATAGASALVAALLSSLVPSVRAVRVDPARSLGTRDQEGGGRRGRLGRVLIGAQIAISVPLVVGAGLFLRTLGNLTGVDPGFDPTGVAVFGVDAAVVTDDEAEEIRIYREVLEGLRALPAVRSATVLENIFITGWRSSANVTVDGEESNMDMNAVSAGFLETMRIPLASGRTLRDSDDGRAPRVALVNETAERELFGGSALGKRFEHDGRQVEVVGVIRDAKYTSLTADVRPTFYDPYAQRPGGLYTGHYAVRAAGSPAELEAAVREVVARVAPGLPVTGFGSQTGRIEAAIARERLFARLLSLFGVFALGLACVGVHGVTAFAVARRKAEFGVRLALGAEPRSIASMVVGQMVRMAGWGVAVGLLAAWLAGPVVRSMLFGVAPADPWTLAATALVMGVVVVAAGGLPAWRASRVDPMAALAPGGGGG